MGGTLVGRGYCNLPPTSEGSIVEVARHGRGGLDGYGGWDEEIDKQLDQETEYKYKTFGSLHRALLLKYEKRLVMNR